MKKSTAKFFDRVAAKGWHKGPYFTYTWRYPALRRWLSEQILPEEKHILSIGCGSGEIERDLIKRGRTVVGLDNSHKMLRSAAKRGLKHLALADARFLPFVKSSFNLILFLESIGYVEFDRVLPEVKRVLTGKGRVIVTFYPPHHGSDPFCQKVSLPRLARELRAAGLRVLSQQMLAVGKKGVIAVEDQERAVLLFALARKP